MKRADISKSRLGIALLATGSMALLAAQTRTADAVVLSYESIDTPSFAVFNGKLYMAYTGTDSNQRLNYASTADGVNWSQVTDNNNRAGGGPAIAVFNGVLYSAFPGINDHAINIYSSTNGTTWGNQYVASYNGTYTTPWRPALAPGGGRLWLAWQGSDNQLHVAASYTAASGNWVSGPTTPSVTVTEGGFSWTSDEAYPPTLATQDLSYNPYLVYTWSVGHSDAPNTLEINLRTVNDGTPTAPTCRTGTTGQGLQGGLGYLPGETLMAYTSSGSVMVDVNGGACGGGSTFGPFGTSGVTPAIVGFNGHAYVAWTGTDGAKHINFEEVF